MTGLRPPPSEDTPSRQVGRILFLLVLVSIFAVVIWAAVTNQQVPLVEDVPLSAVELGDEVIADGIQFHVDDQGRGDTTVVLLHDVDIAGMEALRPLAEALQEETRTLLIDLPGFGLSTRLPSEGPPHTVSSMAERVIEVLSQRVTDEEVILVGVGLGGKVAAEIAATDPDLAVGLVMIDVDFYSGGGWLQTFERMPFIGNAVTYAFEVSGSFSDDAGQPYCEQGGWCATEEYRQARGVASQISFTTESLNAFRNTPEAANVPSRLVDVTVPAIYVWSENGPVGEGSIERIVDALSGLVIRQMDVFQAHLETTAQVADIVLELKN